MGTFRVVEFCKAKNINTNSEFSDWKTILLNNKKKNQ